MALVLTVGREKKLPDSGGYSKAGQSDEIRAVWGVNFLILAEDDGQEPVIDPRALEIWDVLVDAQLPVVNQSTYFNAGVGTWIPYLLCVSKMGIRDQRNAQLWHVAAKFDSGGQASSTEDTMSPIGIPLDFADVANTPPLYATRRDTLQIETYQEDEDATDPEDLVSPTGNSYQKPFYKSYPSRVVTVSQYEAEANATTIEAKRWKVNSDVWNGESAGKWIVAGVDITTVKVWVNDDGSGSPGPIAYPKVTYTLVSNTSPEGWLSRRQLRDTHALKTADSRGTKEAILDDKLQTYVVGPIAEDGTALAPDAATLMKDYRIQGEQSYSFLQNPQSLP